MLLNTLQQNLLSRSVNHFFLPRYGQQAIRITAIAILQQCPVLLNGVQFSIPIQVFNGAQLFNATSIQP
jgi:hypothetical protein